MRRFVGVELSEDVIPDETTVLRFRHVLEEHHLTEAMFAAGRGLLAEQRLPLQAGTIVDATIIAAPSLTKNAQHARHPEMKQTKKGSTWYFGMKVHVGTDTRGIEHSLATTDAARADVYQLPQLLHGEEQVLYADKACWSAEVRQLCAATGLRCRVHRRAAPGTPLSARWEAINRSRSRVRAHGEHGFHVVKRLWGFAKVRYRGLAKHTARAFAAFALANLYLLRCQLLPAGTTCRLYGQMRPDRGSRGPRRPRPEGPFRVHERRGGVLHIDPVCAMTCAELP